MSNNPEITSSWMFTYQLSYDFGFDWTNQSNEEDFTHSNSPLPIFNPNLTC